MESRQDREYRDALAEKVLRRKDSQRSERRPRSLHPIDATMKHIAPIVGTWRGRSGGPTPGPSAEGLRSATWLERLKGHLGIVAIAEFPSARACCGPTSIIVRTGAKHGIWREIKSWWERQQENKTNVPRKEEKIK